LYFNPTRSEAFPPNGEQGQKCRDLARLTDELRRGLLDMAADYDGRARGGKPHGGPITEERRIPLSAPKETIDP
jgi:hypothetical protein